MLEGGTFEKSQLAKDISPVEGEEEREGGSVNPSGRFEVTQKIRADEKKDLRAKAKDLFVYVLYTICGLWFLSYVFIGIAHLWLDVEEFGLIELTTEIIRALLPILPLILGYLYGSKDNN